MPFHGHHHSPSGSYQDAPQNQPGAASGIYQATQALGSIGAPSGSLRSATSSTVSTNPYLSGTTLSGSGSGGSTAPPVGSGLPGPGALSTPSDSQSFTSAYSQPYHTPRRAPTIGRQSDELHIPSANTAIDPHTPQSSHQASRLQASLPHDEYPGNGAPGINLQQATPQHSQFSNTSSGNSLPGALQPGNPNRPVPSSTNTAPSAVPTIPQLSSNSQQYNSPSGSTTMNHLHSHSRSSPAGIEQPKYSPFSNTPEFTSPPSQKYNYPRTPHGGASNSPLGLSDIRPRADSGMSEPTSANPFSYEPLQPIATNCNYMAPWATYAFDWCKWPAQQLNGNNSAGKIAVGSYLEDGHNFIQILDTELKPQSPSESSPVPGPNFGIEFNKVAEATHSYPVTRILWEPPSSQKQSTDLLATSGDHLRLWSLPTTPSSNTSNSITRSTNSKDQPVQKLTPLALLSNSKSPEHTAPLTSLDWNTLSPSLIITSSIDTTCTIWDIPTLTAKTQLIAHDKEVFDVRFCANSVDVFVSCGADGSVRMFDLRSLEHSTIIYEPSEKTDKVTSPDTSGPPGNHQTMTYAPPLLRLAASPHDAHLLATFSQDSNVIRILDVRQPGQALLELRGHAASINCIEWSPSRRGTLASGADDSLVLIWDLLNSSNSTVAPPPAAPINGGGHGQGQQAGGAPAATTAADNGRGPAASWRCDYEVSNISWASHSSMNSTGDEWLGVSGGRGIWGVKM
ncbi:MAG: hypothetical protein M1819_003004 [Sarea resinae]|nr:MAG: hypothetical protein M1819_003004 [Sarea resinae]